jgi:hypothetical protein
LINPSAGDVDITGWTITSADILQGFIIPEGTILTAGGFRSVDESLLPGGLKAVGSLHLFNRFGAEVDSFQWLVDAALSYGRCPDATGAFTPNAGITRSAANICN